MLERVRSFRTGDGRAINTHEVADLMREIDPGRDWRAYRQLRRMIRELAPDIVHTHSSKAGILGRLAAWAEGGRSGRIGVVHTIHGPPFHAYETRGRNALYVQSERFAARRCHAIVSVADAMTRQFLDRGIGRAEQYMTIHSGMELGAYTRTAPGESRGEVRARLGIGPEQIVIGTVSRLAELKGHDDLLDALGEDLRRHPEWRLLWVGDGWWRERLESRAVQLGIRERLVLTGLVPPEAVPSLIRAMDVVVHPSYREGLPRVVPQALLAGIPVVAYDVDGTGEVCIDRETGRLVAPGDVRGLREAVMWMLEQPQESRRTMERGHALCLEQFDARVMVDRLLDLYGSVRASLGANS